MSYKISEQEWRRVTSTNEDHIYKNGYTDAESKLVPIIEERDALIIDRNGEVEKLEEEIEELKGLLRELRAFLVSMLGVSWSDEKHTELLNKVKDI